MKVALRTQYGSPEEIRINQVEKPFPKGDEVLLKVHNTTVNRTDCANLTAKPFIMRFVLGFFKPRVAILGTDFAGEIVSIGKASTPLQIGDRVFGFKDTGSASQAEYMKINAKEVYHIPANINYKQAAASLEGAHYAYSFIHKVSIKPGQQILINGATGAIGSALLQFVRTYDVHITASCNTKNSKRIQDLGANKIIDYTKENIIDAKDTYDFIFDAVGKSTFGKCKRLLKKKGIYISTELGPFAQNLFYPLLTLFTGKKVIFPVPFSTKKTIPYISSHLENETFKPVIDTHYALEDIASAYSYVMRGEKTGNVLIDMT